MSSKTRASLPVGASLQALKEVTVLLEDIQQLDDVGMRILQGR